MIGDISSIAGEDIEFDDEKLHLKNKVHNLERELNDLKLQLEIANAYVDGLKKQLELVKVDQEALDRAEAERLGITYAEFCARSLPF